jgi:hypothetical protein
VFRAHGQAGDELSVFASPQQAEALIASVERRLAERVNSGQPFIDGQGHEHPAENYREFGVSGGFGNTESEADAMMRQAKQAKKDAKEAKG